MYSVGEGNSLVDDDEEDNTSAPIKKVSVPPLHPLSTPTTASSSTIEAESSYGSQLAQLKMMAAGANSGNTVDDLTNDDMSLSDEASLSSAHQRLLAGSSSSTSLRRRTLPAGLPRASTPTASPEMRNKMRYFMGKYKHQQHDSLGDRGSQKSSATATTSASSLTTSSSEHALN